MKKQLLLCFSLLSLSLSAQTWLQVDTATGSEAYHMDNMGSDIALSDNGKTAIVGAPRAIILPNPDQGKVYMLEKVGSIWTEQQVIKAPDGAKDDWFGYSVDISADGNTAIIGAHRKTVDTTRIRGKIYIYARSAGTWTKQGEFVDPAGVYLDNLGVSVSISGDGNTALAGAQRANGTKGKVVVLTRTGGTWSYLTTLTASDGRNSDDFGIAVDISKDGNTAIVGASRSTSNLTIGQAGKAYIFTRSGNTWTEQAKLIAPDILYRAHLGYAVQLSADGNTAVVGAPYFGNTTVDSHGKAYVFTRTGSAWSYQASFTHPDIAKGDYFGSDISLSNDGHIAVLGTNHKLVNNNAHQGKVYTFVRNGTSWAEQGQGFSSADPQAGEYFGTTAISGDGTTIAVGALAKKTSYDFQGKVYIYNKNFITGMEEDAAFAGAVCHPNPTTGNLRIELGKELANLTVHVSNIRGETVRTLTFAAATKLDLPIEAPNGLYFVTVKDEKGQSFVWKVVKQ